MRARGADEIETERRGQEDEILHATRWKFKVSFDHQMEPRWSKGKGRGEMEGPGPGVRDAKSGSSQV
jgi:hypothetical protein